MKVWVVCVGSPELVALRVFGTQEAAEAWAASCNEDVIDIDGHQVPISPATIYEEEVR